MKLDPDIEARVAEHATQTEAELRQRVLGRTYSVGLLPTPPNVGYTEAGLIAERLVEHGVMERVEPVCSNWISHEDDEDVALPRPDKFFEEPLECPECGETTRGHEAHHWRSLVGITAEEMDRRWAEKEAEECARGRLRDAAPDLLAACNAALPEIRCLWSQLTGRPTNQIDGGVRTVLEQIEAAIAKAEAPR